MKKLIFLFALAIGIISTASAQYTPFRMICVTPQRVVKAADTAKNVDTTYLYFTTTPGVLSIPGTPITYNNDIVINYTVTQDSATAAGNVIFQGSMDTAFSNTTGNWVTLVCDKNFALIKDTGTVSGTTLGTFVIPNCKWRQVRARQTSSIGGTSSIVGTAWVRQRT